MWAIVLFDLPTRTVEDTKAATKYRTALRRLGFEMMQRSVYVRHRATVELAEGSVRDAQRAMPRLGIVGMLQLTDEQYDRMEFFRDRVVVAQRRRPRLVVF